MRKLIVVFFIFCLILEQCQSQEDDDMYLPSFMWDPKNPFFQCQQREIRIRSKDIFPVFCGNTTRHNYLTNRFNSPVIPTEVLFVATEQEYNTCDISKVGLPVLKCDSKTLSDKRYCNNGYECTQYYNWRWHKFGPEPVFLKKGKWYHFVGAKQDRTNPSPCHGNTTEFPNPMKFKLYVCTEKEEHEGLCDPCNTEGCYYKGCKVNCGEWKDTSQKVFEDKTGKCYRHQYQICTDELLSTTNRNTRENPITCPEPVCDRWRESDSIMYKNGACSRQKDRECTDFRGKITVERESFKIDCPPKECTAWGLVESIERKLSGSSAVASGKTNQCFEKQQKFCTFKTVNEMGAPQVVPETREIAVDCPAPVTIIQPSIKTTKPTPTPNLPSVAAKTVEEAVDKNTYIYIIIGASLASLVFGILLGYCLTRCCQRSSSASSVDMNVSEKMATLEGIGPVMAYENKNFTLDPVMEDGQLADVEFIPATATIGKTKRQVMVARSISFYNPENPQQQQQKPHHLQQKQKLSRRSSEGDRQSDHVIGALYRPPSTIRESSRNVMRHPSATSKTVLIRHSSDVTERNRSDSDTSVFNLKQPEDCISEQV